MHPLAKTDKIVKGSVLNVAIHQARDLADVVAEIDAIIVLDTSLSMNTYDAPDGKSRFEYALSVLEQFQNKYEGKIALLCFNDEVVFCPSGFPPYNLGDNSTDMVKALNEILIADAVPSIKKILISDGEPNDPGATLEVARKFKKSKVDTIYIGSELYDNRGRDFLKKLSDLTGGQFNINASGKLLDVTITKYLEVK